MAAAIVGGVISALAVVVGVYLAQYLTRRQIREERLRELVASISSGLTPIALSLWDLQKWPSSFVDDFTGLTGSIIEAETVLAGLGKKRISRVEPHLRLLNQLLMAAVARKQQLGALKPEEHTALILPMRELNKAVRPTANQSEDFLLYWGHYVEHGLAAAPPIDQSTTL